MVATVFPREKTASLSNNQLTRSFSRLRTHKLLSPHFLVESWTFLFLGSYGFSFRSSTRHKILPTPHPPFLSISIDFYLFLTLSISQSHTERSFSHTIYTLDPFEVCLLIPNVHNSETDFRNKISLSFFDLFICFLHMKVKYCIKLRGTRYAFASQPGLRFLGMFVNLARRW